MKKTHAQKQKNPIHMTNGNPAIEANETAKKKKGQGWKLQNTKKYTGPTNRFLRTTTGFDKSLA